MIKRLRKAFILPLIILLNICIYNNIDVMAKKSSPPAVKKAAQAQAYVKIPQTIAFYKGDWIYILPANSSQPVKLVKGCSPSLSPDGKTIVYQLIGNDGNSGLSVIDVDSKQVKTLIPKGQFIREAKVSPKGDLVAYAYYDTNANSDLLYLMNMDGSNKKKLLSAAKTGDNNKNLPNSMFSINWNADGNSVVFQDMDHYYEVNLNGEIINKQSTKPIAANNLTSADYFTFNPLNHDVVAYTKSVKGTKEFEYTYHEPNTALFTYNTKTKASKRLTPPDIMAMNPIWSADGKFIYFVGFRDYQHEIDRFDIYRINPDGTGLIKIGKGEGLSL